ncbi:hypothetical protein QUF72_01535 [Desulfobacterales bacterium HSG2]|nr:hypothetical protein [Desulfobacterales bacterium HSG2]
MKNSLLPFAGGKALDIVNTVVSGRNRRASMALEVQTRKELAQLSVASKAIEAQTRKQLARLAVVSQVIDIAGMVAEGMDHRATLRADIEKRREDHLQFTEKFEALQTYIRQFHINELSREDQKPFHQAFLDLMRRA